MKRLLISLAFLAAFLAPTFAQTIYAPDGILATGPLGENGIGRSDAGLEVTNGGNQVHALIAITNDINPGSTSEEAAISFQARSSDGVMKQTASISAVWPTDAAANTGFASLRLNVDDAAGGSEIFMRGFGRGNGVTFYGTTEADRPGFPAVKFNRKSGYPSIVGNADLVLEGAPASAGIIFLNPYNAGNVWVGHGGGRLVLASNPPAASNSACTTGAHAWDANYTYVCIATNTWRRTALSAF